MSTALSHAFHRVFDQPFDTGERIFPLDYLLFATQGSFRLETASRFWLLPPQRAALIRAGTPIRVSTTGPATAASVLFGTATAPESCRVFTVRPPLGAMIAHAMHWPEGENDSPAAATFFRALGDVAQEMSGEDPVNWLPRPRSPAVRRAVDRTLADLDQPQRLAEVAAAAHLSVRTLSRRFEEELGMGWRDFRHRARLLKAAELLLHTPPIPVTEIALAVGFSGSSSFVTAFRGLFGCPPTAYRRTARPTVPV